MVRKPAEKTNSKLTIIRTGRMITSCLKRLIRSESRALRHTIESYFKSIGKVDWG